MPVVIVLVIAALLMACIQTVAWYDYIFWDTISYLELAQQFRLHNYSLFINPYWSPLYPLLFGLLSSLAPSVEMERPLLVVMQLLCFVLFLFASRSFWCAVWKLHLFYSEKEGTEPLPRGAAIVFFTYVTVFSALVVGDVSMKTPDLLAAAIYLYANAAVLSCLYQENHPSRFAMVGTLLGLAYLAKSFFISVALPCIALMRWRGKEYGLLSTRSMICLVAPMLLVIALYVIPLSVSLGKVSLGESGKYQLLFCTTQHLSPAVPLVHGSQETKHPARILFENPRFYEFVEPFDVTYPPWFNPHYWNDGIKMEIKWPLFSGMLIEKFVVLCTSFGIYFAVLYLYLVTVTRTLFPFSLQRIKSLSPIAGSAWFGAVILLVLTVWPRYVIGLVSPIFAGFIICFDYSLQKSTQKLARGLSILSTLMLLTFVWNSLLHLYFAFPQIGETLKEKTGYPLPPCHIDKQSPVAKKLKELSIKPGERVARIAMSEGGELYWARLAQVRIVCESVDVEHFFQSPPERRLELYGKLRKLGVKAILLDGKYKERNSKSVDVVPNEPGWQMVEGTSYYVLPLDKS